ncbi:hypothetical protein TcasGA2_TC005666 [Tribolium castaneum]|uniref:Uncharacterized protein n=1 Tax=Tribolium castaneum TaxID=7070 RepID=D6WWZ7_TRICA|nr:hypothetical protein TcasGA2_TC005666 [Tribolium castaneum]
MVTDKNTHAQSMQAQIAWHVKYSNNKKAYPTQHANSILIAYWSYQQSTQLAVKYQYEFEVTRDWKVEDHPCAHVHDNDGTALYCLKKPTGSFGRHYPCASNTITEGAPIIIDFEISGMFIGISTLDSCDIPIDKREAGSLPGLGIAIINSYHEVFPQHKIAQDFLRSAIGTQYSYTDLELGWNLHKTGSNEPVILQPKPQDNDSEPDIFGYNARNQPKCVLDGSSDLLVQKFLIFGGVFLSLYFAINFSL